MGSGSASIENASGAARLLRRADMADLMRLKESAGWNQTERDWERLLDLEPEGCYGIERDGVIVASATAVTYGRDLAWIGMVLTLPEHRGHGYARRLMECTMEFCARRGVAVVGLDATDMGRPLYEKFGFVEAGVIERWERTAGVGIVAAVSGIEPWTLDAALDRAAFGADRSALLQSLASAGAGAIPGEGFAMARPGTKAAYFGPCVARTPAAARRLLHWFLLRHAGEAAFWDILAENHAAVALAEEHGFRRVRKLTRMLCASGDSDKAWRPDSDLTYAICGFAYG